MTQKTTDSPLDEIHRTRREISDRFGGDIVAIAEDAARGVESSDVAGKTRRTIASSGAEV